jgi:hypothetical protein
VCAQETAIQEARTGSDQGGDEESQLEGHLPGSVHSRRRPPNSRGQLQVGNPEGLFFFSHPSTNAYAHCSDLRSAKLWDKCKHCAYRCTQQLKHTHICYMLISDLLFAHIHMYFRVCVRVCMHVHVCVHTYMHRTHTRTHVKYCFLTCTLCADISIAPSTPRSSLRYVLIHTI